MTITKFLLKYLETYSIIAKCFFPKSEMGMAIETKPWTGNINLPASEEERETMYFDPSTKYWYFWLPDEDAHVFRLYQFSTYWFWRMCMLSCDLLALNYTIQEKRANQDADSAIDEQDALGLDKLCLCMDKLKAKILNEVPYNQ